MANEVKNALDKGVLTDICDDLSLGRETTSHLMGDKGPHVTKCYISNINF